MRRTIFLKLFTSLVFTLAAILFSGSAAKADGFGYYDNGDPDCPLVTYGPWFTAEYCDTCVTYYESCWLQCEDVYYWQNYPNCTVAPGPFGDLHYCTKMCEDSRRACLRDGPCIP